MKIMAMRRSMTWIAVGVTCTALAWLAHMISVRNEEVHMCWYLDNLKQMGLILHNYATRHGCYPPAYVADATGKPLHS